MRINTKRYLIFECYYKHGEYSTFSINYIDELNRYKDGEYTPAFDLKCNCEKCDLECESDLIDAILDIGEEIIEDQAGYGIVAIYDVDSCQFYSKMNCSVN